MPLLGPALYLVLRPPLSTEPNSLSPLQEIRQDTWRIPKPEIIVSAPEIGRKSQSISYKIIKSQEHYYQVENNISQKTQMKEQSEL